MAYRPRPAARRGGGCLSKILMPYGARLLDRSAGQAFIWIEEAVAARRGIQPVEVTGSRAPRQTGAFQVRMTGSACSKPSRE
jgi:hypothetical protein